MTRERIKVRPLLAVAAAFSLAACGSSQPSASATAPPIGAIAPTPVATSEAPATGALESSKAVAPTSNALATPAPTTPTPTESPAAKPLTMPNGSPACGNVTMRAPPNPNCKP